jgi:hypothetical protein
LKDHLEHQVLLKGLHTVRHIKDGHLVVAHLVVSVFLQQQIITHMKCGDKVAAAHQHFVARVV